MTTTRPRPECAISLFRGCQDYRLLQEGGGGRRRGAGCSLGYYVLVLDSPVSVPLVMAWQASRRAKAACRKGRPDQREGTGTGALRRVVGVAHMPISAASQLWDHEAFMTASRAP
jgi:hypothetical protein